MNTKTFSSRLQVCGLTAILPVLPLSGRLFYLQAFQHQALSDFASREFSRKISEIGQRGNILDCSGAALARSLPTWSCSVLKNEAKSPARIAPALSKAAGIPVREIEEKWRAGGNFLRIRRKIEPETAQKISDLKLPGVSLTLEQTRYYPGADIARDLLGTVGTEGNGLSGLELLYDRILSGSLSRREVIRDGAGRIIYRQDLKEGEPSPDVYLTLDKNMQFFSQQAIRRAVEKNRAALGIVIVQDPSNGNILAMSSYPQNAQKTPALQWVYEPGSTFKLITMTAALERRAVTLKDTFDCENGSWEMNPKVTIHDHEPEGVLSVPKLMERSSNIGFAKMALKLGLDDFYYYVRAFGFGTKTGLGFPGESSGLLRPPKSWKAVDLAVAGYGHGIGATAIQVINAYSAVANGGLLMEPRIVDKIAGKSGQILSSAPPMQVRRVLSEKTAAVMKEMLERVVESGTGTQAKIRSYRVAGKTGTSQKLDSSGKYLSSEHVASFCGFFPASKPRFTVLVVLDNPRTMHYGGETAAPAFAEIAKRILVLKGIAPDRAEDAAFSKPARLPVTSATAH